MLCDYVYSRAQCYQIYVIYKLQKKSLFVNPQSYKYYTVNVWNPKVQISDSAEIQPKPSSDFSSFRYLHKIFKFQMQYYSNLTINKTG